MIDRCPPGHVCRNFDVCEIKQTCRTVRAQKALWLLLLRELCLEHHPHRFTQITPTHTAELSFTLLPSGNLACPTSPLPQAPQGPHLSSQSSL